MRARGSVVIAMLGASALVATFATAVGHSATAIDRASLLRVNFVNTCGFSHRAPDDPIVAPGRPGASHDHTFVGAQTTSAASTTESLRASASTCNRLGHTAAYWMPTLLGANARPVEPAGATIYYRRSTLAEPIAFPQGFRMIAGDARASAAQSTRITSWSCGPNGAVRANAEPPQCPPGRATALRLRVTFPSCWDGSSLDSSDHRSHVTYPRRSRCPASHPVALPAITLIYRFPRARGRVSLSSGGVYTAHADFVNSWEQGSLESLVKGCLVALRHCGKGV